MSSTEQPIYPPANRTQLHQLIDTLRLSPVPSLHEILSATSHDVLACLPDDAQPDILDEHELDPILRFHILLSRLETGQEKLDALQTLAHAHQFCTTVDRRHARLISPKSSPNIYLFAQHLTQWSSRAGQLENSIEPLMSLIRSYGEPNILTPLHNELLKISLQSRSIERARELTDLDIDIDQEEYPIRYQDHLNYHYLAGTVQALHKNYQRAIHLLTIAVSAPGPGISQIQVDAYKKLILISLLWTSSPPLLPPYTNSQFKSAFKSVGGNKVYLDFMASYELAESTSEGYVQLVKMAEKNRPSFQKDNNYALVKLCMESLPKKAIKKLIPICVLIPTATVDMMLGELTSGNASSLVQSMIEAGDLNAEIDTNTHVIKFLDQGQTAQDPKRTQQKLRETIESVQSMDQCIREISAGIARDKEFLRRLVQDVQNSSTDKHHSSPNEILQSMVSSAIDKNSNGIIEEDLAVDVGMAWDD